MRKKIIHNTFLFISIILVISIFKKIFGDENSLVIVAGITASLYLVEIDYTLSPIKNTLKFVLIEVAIGIAAFIASLNSATALIITFIMLFMILYLFTYDTKRPMHIPFSLGYLFLLYTPISLERMPFRIGGLIFCGLFIMLIQIILNKNKFLKKAKMGIIENTNAIKDEVDFILNKENYNVIKEKQDNIHKSLSSLLSLTHERILKGANTSELCNTMLSIILSLESINITLRKINDDLEHIGRYDNILLKLKVQLENIIKYINKDIDSKQFSIELKEFLKYEGELKYEYYLDYELQEKLSILNDSLDNLESGKLHEYYRNHNKIFKIIKSRLLKSNFNKNSLKFSYAFRGALVISISVFVVDYFNIVNGKWIIFTILSVIQPYLEYSKNKGKNRIVGTIIGVLLFEVLFFIFKTDSMRMMVILVVGYISNYPTKYDHKMICITISSLGAASIGGGDNLISLDRLIFIIIGTAVALIANRLILPYRIKFVTKDLIDKSFELNNKIINELENINIDNNKELLNMLFYNKIINNHINFNNTTILSLKIKEYLD
ncbi:MAG: FUSC family protein, partial [Romboutsia sp.]